MTSQDLSRDAVNLLELEPLAKQVLPKMVFDYYAGGAESEYSVRENRAAFERYRLVPRCLVDVSRLDTTCTLIGRQLAFPVLVAPMAMQRAAHADGELGVARAAAAAKIPMVVSTMATTSITEVASSGHPFLLFQLYVIRDRDIVRGWVQEAERGGYAGLVVTVDAQVLGRREADHRNRFRLPDGLQLANLEALRDRERARLGSADVASARALDDGSALFTLFSREVDDTLTWQFLPWLRSVTRLPIWVKGILSPDDAELALHYGVDGIVLSNHGGRQLDYAPAALDMLPLVAARVAGRVPLVIDGGVRRGTDVLKALALGATAVLLGRPVLWALALGGEAGVARALSALHAEVKLAMALAGCPSLADVGPQMVLGPAGLPLPTPKL